MAVPIKLAAATWRIEEVCPSCSPPNLSTRASFACPSPKWTPAVPTTYCILITPCHPTQPAHTRLSKSTLPCSGNFSRKTRYSPRSRWAPVAAGSSWAPAGTAAGAGAPWKTAAATKSGGAGSRSGPAYCFGRTFRILDGLSLRRLFLILASSAYREGYHRDPDPYDEDEGHGGDAGRKPDGTEERVRVYDEDKAADGSTHYTCRQYADDIRRNGGGDQTADEQSRNDRPRHLRQAEAEQEADARANGDHELAGIDGADDLARLHTSRREQRRGRDGTPASASEGVEEPGHKPERTQERPGDGPYLDGTLGPPEREPAEDVDAKYEEEYGHRRLDVRRCRFQRGCPDQHQRSQ